MGQPSPGGSVTHRELVERAVRWLRNTRGCSVVFAELATQAGSVPDAIGWRRGWSVLVEAKVSRGDFLRDRRKAVHLNPDGCYGQERWYMTPPGLVDPDEELGEWGLLEAHPNVVRVARACPRRRRYVAAPGELESPRFVHERLFDEIKLLVSACRRHQLGVVWDHEVARFEPLMAAGVRKLTEERAPHDVLLTQGGAPAVGGTGLMAAWIGGERDVRTAAQEFLDLEFEGRQPVRAWRRAREIPLEMDASESAPSPERAAWAVLQERERDYLLREEVTYRAPRAVTEALVREGVDAACEVAWARAKAALVQARVLVMEIDHPRSRWNELDRLYAAIYFFERGERSRGRTEMDRVGIVPTGDDKRDLSALHDRTHRLREGGMKPTIPPYCWRCYAPVEGEGMRCGDCRRGASAEGGV